MLRCSDGDQADVSDFYIQTDDDNCRVQQDSSLLPGHDKTCPSCGVEIEICAHVLSCNESGRMDVLHKLIDLLDRWLKDNGTEVDL